MNAADADRARLLGLLTEHSYAEREVTRINEFEDVNTFLSLPRPSYVIVPEDVWPYLFEVLRVPVHEVDRRYDFYARKHILVIANRYAD